MYYNDTAINRCPFNYGYCTNGFYYKECEKDYQKDNWPTGSGCAYANGIAVSQEDICDDGKVHLRCPGGCTCSQDPWEHANWNGLCAYNSECDYTWNYDC